MLERRRYVRSRYEEPVRFRKMDYAEEVHFSGALARDVCENGIRFITDQFIPVHSRLMVEMNFPFSPKIVKVVAQPAWIREIPSSEQFEIGNCFLEITQEDRDIIRNYVRVTTGFSSP